MFAYEHLSRTHSYSKPCPFLASNQCMLYAWRIMHWHDVMYAMQCMLPTGKILMNAQQHVKDYKPL